MCRFKDAVAIQQGACNLSGITHTLRKSIDEVFAEGKSIADIRTDPAIRLIIHQMGHLVNIDELDQSLTTYSNLLRECELRGG